MSDINKVIVFGATGQTGSRILKKALDAGLEVTAYVRTPSKIPEDIRNRLYKIVKGDASDTQAIEDAIKEQDAVLSALGSKVILGASDEVMSTGIKNILAAMKKHKKRNLIIVSGALQLPGIMRIPNFFLRRILGAIADHVEMMRLLQAASDNIDWIAIMPPNIEDSDAVEPNYLVAKDELPGQFHVTAAEIADFMIKIITNKEKMMEYRHSRIGISSLASSGLGAPIILSLLMVGVGLILYYKQ